MTVSLNQIKQWAAQQKATAAEAIAQFKENLTASTAIHELSWGDKLFKAAALHEVLSTFTEAAKSPQFDLNQFKLNLKNEFRSLSANVHNSSNPCANLAQDYRRVAVGELLWYIESFESM